MFKKLLGRKRRKKNAQARRKLVFLGLCCAFCAGAGLTGWYVYTHRQTVARVVKAAAGPRKLCGFLFGKKA